MADQVTPWLTAAELQELTGRTRWTAQARTLAALCCIAASLSFPVVSKASEPVGCYLPDHCGIPGMTCEIQCAVLSEFDWFRYCDGPLSDGYVWHPVFGGQYATRLRVEQNMDMTFITHNDSLTWDDAESPLCGDWGLHIRP